MRYVAVLLLIWMVVAPGPLFRAKPNPHGANYICKLVHCRR